MRVISVLALTLALSLMIAERAIASGPREGLIQQSLSVTFSSLLRMSVTASGLRLRRLL
jgi:hypothetical protein